jgi:hypothetical protein
MTAPLLITAEALAALRANGIRAEAEPLGDLFVWQAPPAVRAALVRIDPDPSRALLKVMASWRVFHSPDQAPRR